MACPALRTGTFVERTLGSQETFISPCFIDHFLGSQGHTVTLLAARGCETEPVRPEAPSAPWDSGVAEKSPPRNKKRGTTLKLYVR